MAIKKYSSGSWVDTPYRKYETAIDTITTLPKTIIGDGQNISAFTIKGNMIQSGTPTPSSPIYPTECGDLVTTGVHAGQCKIPISCGGTTTTVYLGEVETKRRISKLVLTGDEAFPTAGTGSNTYCRMQIGTIDTHISDIIVCSHCQYTNITTTTTTYGCDIINSAGQGYDYLAFRLQDLQGSSLLKTWLAQQYAAGTPVTVWCALTTPTTGIVNEPIRKIGDYSDSVSVSSIPTTGTAEQVDVDTTLKPSEVSLTYHGWHEHSDTKYTI